MPLTSTSPTRRSLCLQRRVNNDGNASDNGNVDNNEPTDNDDNDDKDEDDDNDDSNDDKDNMTLLMTTNTTTKANMDSTPFIQHMGLQQMVTW